MAIGITLALLLVSVGLIYAFLVWNFDYWRKRGVPGPKPIPFAGNFPSMMTGKRHMVYDMDDIYRSFKKDADFVGIFNCRVPQLLAVNHELVHRIFINDFKHFHDNSFAEMVDEKSDFLFANNPFSLTGETWKERRAEVSSGLTMNRVKATFPVTQKVCQNFIDYIRREMPKNLQDGLDAKKICLLYTSDIASDCVLGVQAKSFTDEPTPIYEMAKKLFDQSYMLIAYMICVSLFPSLTRFYKATFIPKPVENFFVDLMGNAINLRKANPVDRIDFLNYILQLQEKKKLNLKELTAHSMTFFLDGFETTAGALTNCLLLVARSAEIQKKLREEIMQSLGEKGHIDFEKLIELPYLDACIHESLRIFPPAMMSGKTCTEPIELVNKNGSVFKVNKGDSVALPLYSIMMDEHFYPEPQEFKPERFLPENGGVKKYRDMGVYYAFGDGPRICLGMRFALLQIKAAIVVILRNFDVKVNAKTRKDNMLHKTYFIARLDGDVWLNFEDLK